MRIVKIAGRVALAVAAAVAIIGPGSASTQEEDGHNRITLCKQPQTLCKGEKWANGKLVEAKSTDVEFLGPFFTALCETYRVRGRIEKGMGITLPVTTVATVRKIEKCGKSCTEVKIEAMTGQIEVAAVDVYTLLVDLKIKFVCLGSKCVYKGHNVLDVDETYLDEAKTERAGKPILLAKAEVLEYVEGPEACKPSALWHGSINLTGNVLTIFFALTNLTQHETELQPEIEHEAELSEESWHEKELHADELHEEELP